MTLHLKGFLQISLPKTSSSAGTSISMHSRITLAVRGTKRSISLWIEACWDSLTNEKMPVTRIVRSRATPSQISFHEGSACWKKSRININNYFKINVCFSVKHPPPSSYSASAKNGSIPAGVSQNAINKSYLVVFEGDKHAIGVYSKTLGSLGLSQ